jgi:hypothetical protein
METKPASGSKFSPRAVLFLTIALVCFAGACWLGMDAIHQTRLSEARQNVKQVLQPPETLKNLDDKIQIAARKLKELEPGPPPAWYSPRYYYIWLPKAKVYEEAQHAYFELMEQKRQLVQEGRLRLERSRSVWNFGIAPILHLLLAFTLLIISSRWILRIALWQGWFGLSRL